MGNWMRDENIGKDDEWEMSTASNSTNRFVDDAEMSRSDSICPIQTATNTLASGVLGARA